MTPNSTIAHYRIISKIGEGGMGAVYRATDTKLARDVAIKVLPEAFANDPDRMARFTREAQLLASLNHSNIATIYGIEENAIVMELVEGPTLADRIAQGALPLDEALAIARQIAEALETAHEKNIIHRDLKPANVKVTPEGKVKVLDFGLAKLTDPRESTDKPESAPTVVKGHSPTLAGMIMGTAEYMSPEQAAGKSVDKRSDIWAFGVVLFEMLTGARMFAGETVSETLADVMRAPIDLGRLPKETPPAIRALIERCLERNVRQRLRDIGEARLTIERYLANPTSGTPAGQSSATVVATSASNARAAKWAFGVISALAIMTGFVAWRLATERQFPDPTRYRFRPFATESQGEAEPRWSPDGKSIAYSTGGKLVVKSLDGSAPVVLRSVVGATGSAYTWRADSSGLLVTNAAGDLLAVSRAGGDPTPIPGPRIAHTAAVSPDGRTLAALILEEQSGKAVRSVVLTPLSRAGGRRLFTVPGTQSPNRLGWSPNGRFLLLSAAVNPRSGLWLIDVEKGGTTLLASGETASNFVAFSWLPDSRHAVMSWPKPGSVTEMDLWLLDTFSGERTPVLSTPASTSSPAVSPDGSTFAFTIGSEDRDLAEIPLDGSPVRPLLATALGETAVAWSPVAPEFAYARENELRIRRRDGSIDRAVATARDFSSGTVEFISPAISPDGTRVVYTVSTDSGRRGWISAISGGAPTPVGEFPGEFLSPAWSPDGRWIAFVWEGQLAKIRVGSQEPPIVISKVGCRFCPSWSPDGSRILCGNQQGLYTVPASGGAPEFLNAEYERLAAWSPEMRFLFVLKRSGEERHLGRLDWKSGAFQEITTIPPTMQFRTRSISTNRLSLAPDGKSLATSLMKATGDIWILEGFRGPRTLWERLWKR